MTDGEEDALGQYIKAMHEARTRYIGELTESRAAKEKCSIEAWDKYVRVCGQAIYDYHQAIERIKIRYEVAQEVAQERFEQALDEEWAKLETVRDEA